MSARKFASLVPVVISTFFVSLPEWNPATRARVGSRPTPSAYPIFVRISSFWSRVISSSVSASTPDSDRSYLTRCSQVDCMRSISKTGNFICRPSSLASALLGVRAKPLQLLAGDLEHVRPFERPDAPGHLNGVHHVRVAEQDGQRDEHAVGGGLLERERARLVADGLAEVGRDRSELERSVAELVGRRDRRGLVSGADEDRVDHATDEGVAALGEGSDVAEREALFQLRRRRAQTG